MDFTKIFPPTNFNKLKPQIDHKENFCSWKTYITASYIPLIAHYYISGGFKRFSLTFGGRGPSQAPLLGFDSKWSNQGRTDTIVFPSKNGPKNIHFLDYKTEGTGRTVEIGWWNYTTSTGKSIERIAINPDNSITIKWKEIKPPQFLTKTTYDKQGNLLYISRGLPTGGFYEIELLSPGTYKLYLLDNKKATNRWAAYMRGAKIIRV